MGVGPMNLVITNDALYQLSYTSISLPRQAPPSDAIKIIPNRFHKSKGNFSAFQHFLHFYRI